MPRATDLTLDHHRVTLLRALEVGALTEVFLAEDDARTTVVVKRLHRHLVHEPTAAAMFEHEARILGVLAHPGLPRLLAQGFDEGRPVFVERFQAGVMLDGLIARGAGCDAAAAIVLGLLDALGHAHGATDADGAALAVVHRDVAPTNVLVAPTGAVSLVDFGISTSRWRVDPSRGVMKGTRGYMAPEVITGARDADARSNLFVVGVLLFELATGTRCYPGNALQAMHACVEGPPPAPASPLPEGLSAVLVRALARDPDDRFDTAADMARALHAAARDDGLDVTPERLRDALPPP